MNHFDIEQRTAYHLERLRRKAYSGRRSRRLHLGSILAHWLHLVADRLESLPTPARHAA